MADINYEELDRLLERNLSLHSISVEREQLEKLVMYAKGNYITILINMNNTALIGSEEARLAAVNQAYGMSRDMIKIIADTQERSQGETAIEAARASLIDLKKRIDRALEDQD